MSKTNFEYLKDICVGNDEALEFIEAAEKDYSSITEQWNADSKRVSELETANEELMISVSELEEDPDYPDTINAGVGEIDWHSDNLQLRLIMEALGEKIKSIGPLKCLRLLEVRPQPAIHEVKG